jgi:hypothetical protein
MNIKLFYENPYLTDSKTNINILPLSDEDNNIQAVDPIAFILGLVFLAEAILSTFLTFLVDESALFICEFAHQNK